MLDSYKILGLPPGADRKQIRKAYAQAAKACHPDGSASDQVQFQKISTAYETLLALDPVRAKKRHKMHQDFFKRFSRHSKTSKYTKTAKSYTLRKGQGVPDKPAPVKLVIQLQDVCKGAKRMLTLPDDRKIELHIPKGHDPARALRIHTPNDETVLVQLSLQKDDDFCLQGRNILGTIHLPLSRLRQGGNIRCKTPVGNMQIAVPELSSPGQTFRLVGKGLPASVKIPAGHMLLTLQAGRAESFDRLVDHFARRFAGRPAQISQNTGTS